VDVQRADPRLRVLALLVLVAAVAAGVAAIALFQDWLADVAQRAPADARRSLRWAFTAVSGAACVALLALGRYAWRSGARVRSAARFPPPGAHVLRDTPVLRGTAALRRGRLMQGVGVVLACGALGLLALSWRVTSTLEAPVPRGDAGNASAPAAPAALPRPSLPGS
jgi:hypothetical protein